MRSHVAKQILARPKRRQDAMQPGLICRPHHRQYDLITVGTAEQIGQQQILFVVEAVAPLFRVVPWQEDVVQSPDRAWPQYRYYLGKKDGDIRVRETAVAVIDKQQIFRPDPLPER